MIAEKVANTPGASAPSYAVITNSTYDGLLYNTQFIKESLDCKHIHFDSAWCLTLTSTVFMKANAA